VQQFHGKKAIHMIRQNTTLSDALNRAPFDLFHLRVAFVVAMGFLTDSYSLFIITPALSLIEKSFQVSAKSPEIQLVSSSILIASCIGAIIFGVIADRIGRRAIYGFQALAMAVLIVLSALSPSVIVLIILRFFLGIVIGGNYPVTAVLMSEYANAKDRGKLVGMVFSMQAVGAVIGPIIALIFFSSSVPIAISWRLMLALGALPALAAYFLQRGLPESPRFISRVKGNTVLAVNQVQQYSRGSITPTPTSEGLRVRARLWQYLVPLIGTAGTWFVFDYAYYGNSISSPLIIHAVSPDASIITQTFWSLIIFLVAAVPGYVLALSTMDRIGHKRLQWIGFICMGLAYFAISAIPDLTKTVVPFLLVYSTSYFFAQFGPNTTTFVLAAELFPVNIRATAHGIAAGVAKLGAFISVFVFQAIISSNNGQIYGALRFTFYFAIVGCLLTFLLREPARQSLEDASHEDRFQQTPPPPPPYQPQPPQPTAVHP
jgi:MFS transporter, PHS family, inorganic phosphate transporter